MISNFFVPNWRGVDKIAVLNPKRGCGKTTLTSYYAKQGLTPAVLEYDPRASVMHWLKKRGTTQPSIYCVAANEKPF